jgi:LETM1 and EF-hand domain-containing protein 1
VKSDVLKFIPFSIFIIIPGLELALPAWIAIFPNAIPTQFMSDEKKEQKMRETIEAREKGAGKLMYLFP